MNKIKILYVIATLDVGGTERQLVELAKKLDKEKFEPIVCCLTRGGVFKKELDSYGIRVVIIGKKLGYDFSAILKLIKIIKKEKPKIVHTFLWTSNTIGRIAALFLRVPVIISSERCKVRPFKNLISRITDRFLSLFTDKIIANSESVRLDHIKKEKIGQNRIISIPNGIDLERFNPNFQKNNSLRLKFGLEERVVSIGAIGRLDVYKGYECFLMAMPQIFSEFKKVKFFIVGDGPLKTKLQKLANDLGVSSNVVFTGYIEDVREIYSILDIMVFTSLSEGLSNVVLEAMAMGKPVIATNIDSNKELIENNETGILVKPSNYLELSQAVLKFVKNTDLRKKIGQNARIFIEKNHDISFLTKKLEDLYENLLNKKIGAKG